MFENPCIANHTSVCRVAQSHEEITMGIKTTPLLVLAVAATAVGASAQRRATGTPRKPHAPARSAPQQQDHSMRITVAGQIVMPGGAAATGARLFLATNNQLGGLPEEIKIDPTGRFRRSFDFDDRTLAGGVALSAIVPGKAVLWHSYAADNKTLGSLSLHLEPVGTVTGRIVDVNGKPIAALDVAVSRLGPDFTQIRDSANELPGSPFTEFLPAPLLKTFYQAKTDATGRFTLSGLPPMGQLRLKLGSNLLPAPGSSEAIGLGDRKQTDVGVLVAVTPGAFVLHITDRSNGKPLAGVQVRVLPRNLSLQDLGAFTDPEDSAARARTNGLASDAKGNVALSQLTPGDYRLLFAGTERPVTVTEAHTTRVDVAVRTGPLTGRIVDGAGKPVANLPIMLETLPDPLTDAFGAFDIGAAGRGARPVATTDRNGRFMIGEFPWEASAVTLRGSQGNAEAQWSGAARDIGKALDMRLHTGVLITVTGRLVDPKYDHVKTKTVSLIRWQDAPRLTWLLNAQAVPVDSQGRFQVAGIRRGEAFSLLAGSPFSGRGEESAQGFESPRFTTSRAAGVQALGDVVVHPLDGAQQILQIYGIDSRQQLARLAGLTQPPSAASVDAAREMLARYRAALVSGDFAAVHQLTSPLSAGWSADQRQFMAHTALRIPSAQEAQPLRFVPGISLAYLLALSKPGASPLNISFGAAANDLEANPDWVVFAGAGPKSVRLITIVHREQGEWKIIGSGSVFGSSLDSLFLLSATGSPPPHPAGFTLPAPALDAAAIHAARAAGEKYLAAWSTGDEAAQLALTSALSSSTATSTAGLRKARGERLDEGVCPVRDMAALHLTPIQGLTQWESEWLAEYARKFAEISGQSRVRGQAEADKRLGFPAKFVERGDLIPFLYNADGRDFLILMIKHDDHWQVLEPAVPR
jgi:hypothetical protein